MIIIAWTKKSLVEKSAMDYNKSGQALRISVKRYYAIETIPYRLVIIEL